MFHCICPVIPDISLHLSCDSWRFTVPVQWFLTFHCNCPAIPDVSLSCILPCFHCCLLSSFQSVKQGVEDREEGVEDTQSLLDSLSPELAKFRQTDPQRSLYHLFQSFHHMGLQIWRLFAVRCHNVSLTVSVSHSVKSLRLFAMRCQNDFLPLRAVSPTYNFGYFTG